MQYTLEYAEYMQNICKFYTEVVFIFFQMNIKEH